MHISEKIINYVLGLLAQTSMIVMKHFVQSNNFSWEKQANSVLTQADVDSHNFIVSSLEKHFDFPVVSEEGDNNFDISACSLFWCVDPLDGTKEFINKNREFTINISLIENNIPVLGFISVPAESVTYFSHRNHGAYFLKNNFRSLINCSSTEKFTDSCAVVSRFHTASKTLDFLKMINVSHVLPVGSALKYCKIATGIADLSIRTVPLMIWDIAAADCILHEAGGRITDFYGNELNYVENLRLDKGILASNSLMHDELLSIIKKDLLN